MAAGSVASAALQKPSMNAQQSISTTFGDSPFNVNVGGGSQTSGFDKTTATAASPLGMLKNPMVVIGLCLVAYLVINRGR